MRDETESIRVENFKGFTRALLRVHKIHMDPIPFKRQQFWIRSRVNSPEKVDRIQMDPIPFGSDPCKRGLKKVAHGSTVQFIQRITINVHPSVFSVACCCHIHTLTAKNYRNM